MAEGKDKVVEKAQESINQPGGREDDLSENDLEKASGGCTGQHFDTES
ncbi:MAG: hypothetical protein WAO35_09495 [Terriglobia bacterium]